MTPRRLVPVFAALMSFVPFTSPLQAQQHVTITGHAEPADSVSFDVYLPHAHREALAALLEDQQTAGSANYHRWLTPAEFQARFALPAAKVKAIETELAGYGLSAEQLSPHRLHVTGTASEVQAAFGTNLNHATRQNGKRVLVAASPPQDASLHSGRRGHGSVLSGRGPHASLRPGKKLA